MFRDSKNSQLQHSNKLSHTISASSLSNSIRSTGAVHEESVSVAAELTELNPRGTMGTVGLTNSRVTDYKFFYFWILRFAIFAQWRLFKIALVLAAGYTNVFL
jgi:hypothetical protein